MTACLAALAVAGALSATAWADVAGPDDPYDEDRITYCAPGQRPGDDCTMWDGEDGTCVDETGTCAPPPDYVLTLCHVCEETCSVAAVGTRSSSGLHGLTGGVLLAAALALLRRRGRERG